MFYSLTQLKKPKQSAAESSDTENILFFYSQTLFFKVICKYINQF